METVIKSLLDIAENLDNDGHVKESVQIDKIAESLVTIKTAQYVGFQGYAVRNSRCWSNCYRHKRTENPKMAAQEVWFDCQKEYVESLNNDGSKWDKYAHTNGLVKNASDANSDKFLHKEFNELVTANIENGMDFPQSVFASIDMMKTANADIFSINKFAETINEMAEMIADHDSDIDAQMKVAHANNLLITEAQSFFDRFRGQAGANRRAGDALANQTEVSIKKFQKGMENMHQALETMHKLMTEQQKTLGNYQKKSTDKAINAKLTSAIGQMNATQKELQKIYAHIVYMINTINNSLADAAGRVAVTSPFTPTPQMQQIKNILQANPAFAMAFMNNVFGKGPDPKSPGGKAMKAYVDTLTNLEKVHFQDFLRS